MGWIVKHNILSPNFRFPFTEAHNKYKQKIAKNAVDKNATFASVKAVRRLFKNG
jgi:hypothetical protein